MLGFACALMFLQTGSAATPAATVRTWTDATGRYTTEAALVDFDGQNVVLKKYSGRLIALPIAKLSQADQDYLHSQAAVQAAEQHAGGNRTWTLRDGTKFIGRVLKYGKAKVVIERQYGRVLVNGKPFQEISKPHQYVLYRVVEHFDQVPIKDHQALVTWAIKQGGNPREFDCEGVLMQVEDGEKIAVPFFLFSDRDEKFLRPGWEEWLAAESKAEKASQEELARQQQSELFLRARARDYQRDQALHYNGTTMVKK